MTTTRRRRRRMVTMITRRMVMRRRRRRMVTMRMVRMVMTRRRRGTMTMVKTRTTTRRIRLGTYGSPQREEDPRLAHNGKSLPVPAFVSKTPQHMASSPLLPSLPNLRFGKENHPQNLQTPNISLQNSTKRLMKS